ncbi:hypothetical protein PROFUN_10015 [Planoprotostelium fungivorum]|uniref:Uncharacterized protein n=1 Tax=Planoprotostelium fungivorum TaxID=1890364 RepID=A0A2P6NFR2_9EUKA|nr:hypothetical protein PROFUN_10015 [Planoprotostelium fungivorum]
MEYVSGVECVSGMEYNFWNKIVAQMLQKKHMVAILEINGINEDLVNLLIYKYTKKKSLSQMNEPSVDSCQMQAGVISPVDRIRFNESLFIKNDFKPKKAKEFPFNEFFQFVSDVKCWAQQFGLLGENLSYGLYSF